MSDSSFAGGPQRSYVTLDLTRFREGSMGRAATPKFRYRWKSGPVPPREITVGKCYRWEEAPGPTRRPGIVRLLNEDGSVLALVERDLLERCSETE